MGASAIPLAIGIGGIASAGSSLGAGAMQAGAAENATAVQAQEAQNALNFQEQEFATQQANQAPWLKAGQGAVTTLSGLIPQLNAEQAAYPQFQAPTAAQAAQTPGYQFALQQGLQGVNNSAAARGGLLSGNAIAATEQYGQGLANTNYQQIYNNAFNQYTQGYNQLLNNVNGTYNRYASLAGLGQQTSNALGSEGQAAAQNAGNISVNLGSQIGQNLNNAAAANASGYIGASNAAGGAISNIGQYLTLQQMLNGTGGGSNPYGYGPGQLNPETTPLGPYQ